MKRRREIKRMKMVEILLLGGFGMPIVGLCIYFVYAARRMMREEAEREAIRRQSAQARRYDAKRRRVRYIAAGARTGVCR